MCIPLFQTIKLVVCNNKENISSDMLTLKLVEIIWSIYKQIIFSRYTAIKKKHHLTNGIFFKE